MRSAPYFTPSSTVFLNTLTASSKSKSPYGASILPVGPISSAIHFLCSVSLISRAFFTLSIADLIIVSSSLSLNFNEFAPNVFVLTTFEPASK